MGCGVHQELAQGLLHFETAEPLVWEQLMLLAVLGEFGAEPCGSSGRAHVCTGCVCDTPGEICVAAAFLAVPLLTWYQEGTRAGSQKCPAGI